jgi:hypothetical protein
MFDKHIESNWLLVPVDVENSQFFQINVLTYIAYL